VDQIGRIFAIRAAVYIVHLFANNRTSANVWDTNFHGTSHVLILSKNGWGYIWGDIFTNSPGHPGPNINVGRRFKRAPTASTAMLMWV
jgi:hypothetical protein